MEELLPVIKTVLLDKKVIITAIACFLLMDFASYVCRYKKKPPKKRVKPVAAAPQPAPAENDDTQDEDDGDNE